MLPLYTEENISADEFSAIMSEFWSWRLREVPEFASSVGVHDYDDRLETFTLEAFRKRKVPCIYIPLFIDGLKLYGTPGCNLSRSSPSTLSLIPELL